jgi:hypothetical protein
MVNDMLRLTVDQVFCKQKGLVYAENINRFPIDRFSNEENMWEPLCQMEHTVVGANLQNTGDKFSKKIVN